MVKILLLLVLLNVFNIYIYIYIYIIIIIIIIIIVYFQDLPAETLGYLVEPTVRHQQSSSVQSACHASVVVPYVVPTLVSDRLARHR